MSVNTSTAVDVQEDLSIARKAVWGAFWGFFVDMFDIYLPIVVLAKAITYFEPKDLSVTTTNTIYYFVFAITLVGRPLGALIFGHFADKLGRKRTTLISVSGFGACTFLIGILPGYQAWGLASLIILTVLRLVDGIFLGGEYTSASPLAMEYSPKHKRGWYGGLIMTGFPIAYVVISLVTALVLQIAPLGGPNSAFIQWGWRIPFFIGTLIAIIFVIYYQKTIDESRLWEGSKKTSSPLKELFSGNNLKNFMQVFIMMTGIWFVFNSVVDVLPGVLTNILGLSTQTVTNGLLFVNVLLVFGYISAGVISQHWGRRRLIALFGFLSLVVAPIIYFLLVANTVANNTLGFILAVILELLTISVWGIVTVYINERFKTSVRASGFGLGYSAAVIIPSFFSFYLLWLKHLMPYKYTQIVILMLGGLLILIGALMGPETRDIDFTTD
jgi:MFS family permease